jgi:hypothetical protein
MSRCNPALRWGAGTTKDKVVDTAATREMEQRLTAMRRDRDAVDKMWSAPSSQEAKQISTCQLVEKADEDKKYITFRSSN